MSIPQAPLTTNTHEVSFQPGRTGRASTLSSRFAGKDILIGQEFLAATTTPTLALNSKEKASQSRAETPDAPQKHSKNIHFDGDEEEEPQTPGSAASTLLQKFGTRKTKLPKNAAK
jgi:hypothetical protein